MSTTENLPVRTHADAVAQMSTVAPDLAAMLRVLHGYMDACHTEALECAGDEPATLDECENDGAAQAWGEARDLISSVLDRVEGRDHGPDCPQSAACRCDRPGGTGHRGYCLRSHACRCSV